MTTESPQCCEKCSRFCGFGSEYLGNCTNKTCPCHSESPQWEKEFEKLWISKVYPGFKNGYGDFLHPQFIYFIKDLLATQRAKLKERIEELVKPDLRKKANHKMTCTSCADDRTYNQALQDISDLLKQI